MESLGGTIGGKYRLVRELGRGGMGVVFEATNVVTEARVAIKFLTAEAAKSEFIAGRFMREAKAAGRLRSRYVARVFDADRSPGGEPFIVLELLEGHDLEGEVRRGRLSVERAAALLVQACAGIDEAHRGGIVHRDLKPANLFVAMEGSEVVKVLDFGVSKLPDASDGRATGSLAVLGTLLYMAPESLTDARTVDARADVWALGVILFECLEGRGPFEGDGTAMIGAVLSPHLASPRITRPDVPGEIVEIVARCLEKDRTRRLGSVAELAEMLAPFAPAHLVSDALAEIRGRRFAHSPPGGMVAVDVMGATLGGAATGSPVSRSHAVAATGARGRATSPLLAVVALVVLAAFALAFFFVSRGQRSPVVATEPVAASLTTPPAMPPPVQTIIVLSAPPISSTTPPPPRASADKPSPRPRPSSNPRPHGPAAPAIPTLL